MQAAPANVIDYFNGEKQNLIPLFQRPYTWSYENWRTLWEDVMVQYDLGDGGTHFMGAIVSLPARSVPVGVSKFLVIDGQQRLTTVSLLLCALRDTIPGQAQRIQEVLLTNRFRSPEDTLKFVPTQADRETFRRIVLSGTGTPDGESLITQAYAFFKNQLASALDLNGDKVVPEKVLTALEHCLQVVMINLGESDDPYLIFESLNFKGEPLTQADLVRNYILMRFRHSIVPGGEQERIYENYWRPLEQELGGRLTDFLRHFAMKEGDDPKQGGIYAAIRARLKGIESEQAVEAEVKTMRKFGGFYARVLDPQLEPEPSIRARLESLLVLGVTVSYPLLLRLFAARDEGTLSVPDLERCIAMIESFVVRRSVCAVPTNALNKLFLQWCKNFPSTDHAAWLIGALSAGGGNRRFPNDTEFGEAFRRNPQYGRGPTPRFVLCRIEASFNHKEPVDLSSATIEHVLPQTITAEWEAELSDGNVDANPAEVHARNVDRFGNLTLTAYNTELGNLPFGDKKAKLAQTHVELNRWILECNHWREAEIERRAQELLSRALVLWPGPQA